MDPWVAVVALLLGLARAAAPGPANAESIRRGREVGGFRHRFRDALLVQAGSLAGELGWAALSLLGLAMMLHDPTLRAILSIAGGLLLVGLGLAALRYAATATGLPEIDPAARRPGLGGRAGRPLTGPVLPPGGATVRRRSGTPAPPLPRGGATVRRPNA